MKDDEKWRNSLTWTKHPFIEVCIFTDSSDHVENITTSTFHVGTKCCLESILGSIEQSLVGEVFSFDEECLNLHDVENFTVKDKDSDDLHK